MNYYVEAIKELEKLPITEQRAVCVDYAQRHPKHFVEAIRGELDGWRIEAKAIRDNGEGTIAAIKHCRNETGMSLQDAKAAVEAL